MQEEANQKTVGIAVQGTKMTGRAFLRACEKYLQYRKEQKRLKQQKREPDPASYEINQPIIIESPHKIRWENILVRKMKS